ncbi:TatD family hydrolase [Patescibacteria group bacterium]|nr:TatD family hydrolase [Patescibacteria group bacterium]
MPKYIDIHSHVNFKTFKEDGDIVLKRALQNDTWVINVGSQFSTSKRAVEIANKYQEGIFAIVGLHPIHLEESFHDEEETGGEGFKTRAEEFNKDAYRELLKNSKVVAIGECGLDYFHCSSEMAEKQKEVFIEQIKLANEVKKPLMVHVRNNYEDKSRNAYIDILEILKKYAKVKGVIHFFEGSLENAKDFISFGFMISFSGAITYPARKKGRNCDYEEIIKNISLNMILADTDSPYMAPVPYRGKRNEPVYVKEIVRKIAEIKNLPETEVREAIVVNAKRIFGI